MLHLKGHADSAAFPGLHVAHAVEVAQLPPACLRAWVTHVEGELQKGPGFWNAHVVWLPFVLAANLPILRGSPEGRGQQGSTYRYTKTTRIIFFYQLISYVDLCFSSFYAPCPFENVRDIDET